MKKFLAILLAALMMLAFMACGKTETPGESTAASEEATDPAPTEKEVEDDPFKVATPMTHPVYAFDHVPTTDELRKTVVQAMQDELSVQWYSDQEFTYEKTGSASEKVYAFERYVHYAGLPYANAQRSLFGMLEFLNENGKLDTEAIREEGGTANLGQAVNSVIGNTCAGSTSWAYFSCVNSVSGPCVAYNQCYSYGYLPVGPYTYDLTISTFSYDPTEDIVERNGRDVMYASYAEALPGDLMIIELHESGKEHSTMVIENNVVRNADGSINPQESYIVIQDQHVGLFQDVDANGKSLQYVGHTGVNAIKHSYEGWFDADYVPVTCAELIGLKAYDFGEVKLDNEVKTAVDLKKTHVLSNYPMAVIKLVAKNGGSEQMLFRTINSRGNINDKTAFGSSLSRMYTAITKAGLPAGTTYELQVTLSTGEVFTPLSFTE